MDDANADARRIEREDQIKQRSVMAGNNMQIVLKHAIWLTLSPMSGNLGSSVNQIEKMLDNMHVNLSKVKQGHEIVVFWCHAISIVKQSFTGDILQDGTVTAAGTIKRNMMKYRWDYSSLAPTGVAQKYTNDVTALLNIPARATPDAISKQSDMWFNAWCFLKETGKFNVLDDIIKEIKAILWLCFDVLADRAAQLENEHLRQQDGAAADGAVANDVLEPDDQGSEPHGVDAAAAAANAVSESDDQGWEQQRDVPPPAADAADAADTADDHGRLDQHASGM